jgi:hypothetical protein
LNEREGLVWYLDEDPVLPFIVIAAVAPRELFPDL